MGPRGLHPGGPRARPGLRPGIDSGHDLLQARRAVPALLLRSRVHRTDQPKGFGWRDFRDLLIRARTQPGGPIVLVWDNVRLHLTEPLREFIEANTDWLTVIQLPTYVRGLNPQKGIWSLVKRDIGNLAAADLGQITRAVERRLKMLRYWPEVIDGCLAGTGLVLEA
ncbi:transposase [Streptomyces sp. NPDC002917]|uniref:transposase n=1 Tax=Streptomyces sp. NPDC002917 TaxID=3364671 RepID=UPI00368C2739